MAWPSLVFRLAFCDVTKGAAKSVTVPLAAKFSQLFQPPFFSVLILIFFFYNRFPPHNKNTVRKPKLYNFAIHPLAYQTVVKMLPSCLCSDANSEIFMNISAHLPAQCSHQWQQVQNPPASEYLWGVNLNRRNQKQP